MVEQSELVHADNTALVATALIGLGTALIGADLARRSLSEMHRRGLSLGTITRELETGTRLLPSLDRGDDESADGSSR